MNILELLDGPIPTIELSRNGCIGLLSVRQEALVLLSLTHRIINSILAAKSAIYSDCAIASS